MPNSAKTPKDVYGDNIIADIAELFLIDEPSDLLGLLPGGKGAQAAKMGIREAASPSANMLRKLFRGQEDEIGKGALKRMGVDLEVLARKIPEVGKANPKTQAKEVLMRRLTDDDKNSMLRTGVASLATGDAPKTAFDSLMKFVDEEIEAERQRTGGRGLF